MSIVAARAPRFSDMGVFPSAGVGDGRSEARAGVTNGPETPARGASPLQRVGCRPAFSRVRMSSMDTDWLDATGTRGNGL